MWTSHPDILAMVKIGVNSQEKHIIRRFSGCRSNNKILQTFHVYVIYGFTL